MVDPDILKAIEIIDKKILSLQQARNQLAHAFGVGAPTHNLSAPSPVHSQSGFAQPQKPRKEALAEFITQHGAMSRVEIVAQSGLPEGTVSYCLSDKRFFRQLEDGKWDVTDFSKRGLEMKAHAHAEVSRD